MVIAATNYPFLEIFWTILIFSAWVVWIWMAVTVLVDIFRRHDLSGWGKAAWTVFVVALPFLGVIVYLLGHSEGMAERSNKETEAAYSQFDDHVRTNGGNGAASEITKGKQLLDSGAINQAEFEAIKDKAMA